MAIVDRVYYDEPGSFATTNDQPIPEGLRSIDGAVPFDRFVALCTMAKVSAYTPMWRSDNRLAYWHMNHNFLAREIDNSDRVDKLEHVNNELVRQIWTEVMKPLLPGHALLRCYMNLMMHGIEGMPHSDSKKKGDITSILYLCPEWRPRWGGETMVFGRPGMNEVIAANLPAPQRIFMFPANRWHCARGVTRDTYEPRITLMFKSADLTTGKTIP